MAGSKNKSKGPPGVRVQPTSAVSAHPRRPPAEKSVSIPHGVSTDPKPGIDEQTSNSSSLVAQRDSSGETSNPENWFEKSNKNRINKKPGFDDFDSPFNFENDDSPVRAQHQSPQSHHFPPLIDGDSSGSSSEEYRSVIDDLTIENKRLKKRLKQYERSHDWPLQNDKLFEVRVLGLDPEKKRELEETLRKFASSLNRPAPTGKTLSSSAISAQSRLGSHAKAGSSLSSLVPHVADSGYGSMTTTGKTSTPKSGAPSGNQPAQVSVAQSKNNSIQSYLHDIPEGLMPRHPTAMTEKSKKKLVVRRLEQIFNGRVADPGFEQQPLQQQEVSKSAAIDEKSAIEASGRKVNPEGHREAPIMETETEDPMATDASFQNASTALKHSVKASGPEDKEAEGISRSESNMTTTHNSPTPATLHTEQRPTRPLDLDPHRAQDPVENIEYFRHLGFLNPTPESSMPVIDGQNWIYLNLLVNMAQLHTFNVTTDFVKEAIAESSKKLELSNDGRKVRWKGNDSPLSKSSTNASESSGSPDVNAGDKRSRPSHLENLVDTGHQSKKQAVTIPASDKFAYRPIIPSNKVSSDSDQSSDESMEDAVWALSQHGEAVGGPSARFANSFKRSTSLSVRRNQGPIAFYNNATFCTDLTGDMTLLSRKGKPTESHSITGSPLGVMQSNSSSSRNSGRGGSTRGSAKGSSKRSFTGISRRGSEKCNFDVSELASSIDSLSSSDSPLNFPSNDASQNHVTFAVPSEPIPLEASGIGGVTPHDNIAITVHRQYLSSGATQGHTSVSVNPKLSAILPSSRRRQSVNTRERIISMQEKNLDPSPLPPASLHFDAEDAKSDSDGLDFGSSSSDDGMNDTETAEPTVSVALATRPTLSSSGSPYSSSDSVDEDSTNDEGYAESQIDFLATARAANPEAIREMEREYDAEMAEKLAEDIPAGSSAATAGGGSGFTSPEVQFQEGRGKGKREESVSS